ncbi:hypothetical protein KBTX_03895 [wastewater metagenome]|uniref:Uncharacterized protein n=2 Tax=unclassified sequences TaxID=12908 RepID=A0A5B8RKP3_9ZZZZ|nr:hypothetical protein KBTEX_03895 [uncultured organism]
MTGERMTRASLPTGRDAPPGTVAGTLNTLVRDAAE